MSAHPLFRVRIKTWVKVRFVVVATIVLTGLGFCLHLMMHSAFYHELDQSLAGEGRNLNYLPIGMKTPLAIEHQYKKYHVITQAKFQAAPDKVVEMAIDPDFAVDGQYCVAALLDGETLTKYLILDAEFCRTNSL